VRQLRLKDVDINEILRTFRINNGVLERLHTYKYKAEWKEVKNVNNCKMGYRQVGFNYKTMYYHHIVWILYNKKLVPEGLEIDHINRNKIDNRIQNLRAISHMDNMLNRKFPLIGEYPLGCLFDKKRNAYFSRIKINGDNIYLMYSKNLEEVENAYKIANENRRYYKDKKSFKELIKNKCQDLILKERSIYANSTL